MGAYLFYGNYQKKTIYKKERLFLRFVLVFIIFAQIIYFKFRKKTISGCRSITEYREFFIPYGFLIYSLGFYLKLKKNKVYTEH